MARGGPAAGAAAAGGSGSSSCCSRAVSTTHQVNTPLARARPPAPRASSVLSARASAAASRPGGMATAVAGSSSGGHGLWQRWSAARQQRGRRRQQQQAAAAAAAAADGGESASNSSSGQQHQQHQQQQYQQQPWSPAASSSSPSPASSFSGGEESSGSAVGGGTTSPGGNGSALDSSDALDAALAAPPPYPHHTGCPVYVMLPLDTVVVVHGEQEDAGGAAGNTTAATTGRPSPSPSSSSSSRAVLKRERALSVALGLLAQAGVAGIMVDVWWSACERQGPKRYDWQAYGRLFRMAARAGLRVQAVMSFHAAGGNVGDTCTIPLPRWVEAVGERDPDVFYTDASGHRNRECLSLGCDELPLFWGRTPVEMYRDFVAAFSDEFQSLFGTVITEITVGLGPAGELRYPAYPEGDGRWRFPGVGEWQCYDRYMLASLSKAARAAGRPEWGHGGPHDAGGYNSRVWETGFFASEGGSWDSDYGRFFLSWYSGELVAHAERVLAACGAVLAAPGRPRVLRRVSRHSAARAAAALAANGASSSPLRTPATTTTTASAAPPATYEFAPAVALGAKLAGVHWWFKSRSHAAELTAGYYNARGRDGYAPLMRALAKNGARCSFTCVEMRDCEHPPEGRCSPQGLLRQVLCCAERHGVPLSGENALQRYDGDAFDRIAESAFGRAGRAGRLEQLTFLRMGDLMFDNWPSFTAFVRRMRGSSGSPEQEQG